MDDLDEILTPDSLPATAGMDVDMVSPEASQDSPAHLTSQLGTLVMEPDETVTTAQTDVVLDEAGTLKAEIRTLKAEPSTNASQVCSGQDSFSRTHVPSSKASPAHSLEVLWVDPLEDDLGLGDGLSGLDCALSDTSSSEDEKLLSLQEIMERSVRPPPTPDKDAFPAPSTPVAKAPVSGVFSFISSRTLPFPLVFLASLPPFVFLSVLFSLPSVPLLVCVLFPYCTLNSFFSFLPSSHVQSSDFAVSFLQLLYVFTDLVPFTVLYSSGSQHFCPGTP